MTMVLEDLTETNQLKAHQRMFEKMVSPAVIRQLDKNALHLGGSRATLSVLFADISGFTNLGENVSPEVLLSVVNCYLSAAAEIILDEGGTIDKFLGDSVMAWFNAPLQQPDHALRALRTAWRIREILPQIYSQLETDFHLDFSMGIHTGEAIIGMIGSEKRMEFTAIGDTVNIAKRLQESAQASQIILTAQTAAEVRPHVMLRRLDPLLVRGRRETLEVFELLGIN
jgi:class 3 adenylate cyclase